MIRRLALIVIPLIAIGGTAAAAPSTSPHYRLDPNTGAVFGGQMSSGSYKLVDAGGEAAIGTGSSPSYQLGAGFIAQLQQSIQLSILPSGIISYYPLDTGQGAQAYDVSPNNRQGSLSGTPAWAAGKLGSSLSLNGSSQYMSVAHAAALNLSDNYTITAWVKLTDYAAQYPIISKRSGSGTTNTTYELRVQQTTGQLQFVSYDSSLKTITGTTQVPTGTWAQVAVVKQSGTVTLYLDGTAISTPTAVSSPTTNTAALYVGSNNDTSAYFKGGIDEVRLYNRVLPVAELLADVAAVNSGNSSAQVIPSVTPGIPETALTDLVVRTDAAGYDLAIAQDHALRHTDTTTTVPAISGSIASPAVWTDGTTKGFGFTLISGNNLSSLWGSNPNYKYAAIPGVSTTFHINNGGFSGGGADTTTMQYRLDTLSSQKAGSYRNTVTISATLKP